MNSKVRIVYFLMIARRLPRLIDCVDEMVELLGTASSYDDTCVPAVALSRLIVYRAFKEE